MLSTALTIKILPSFHKALDAPMTVHLSELIMYMLPWALHTVDALAVFLFLKYTLCIPTLHLLFLLFPLQKHTSLWSLIHWSSSSDVISSKRSSLTTANYFLFVPLYLPSTHTRLCSLESWPSWDKSTRPPWSLFPLGFANGKQWQKTRRQEERKIWVFTSLAPPTLGCWLVVAMFLHWSF